MRITIIGNCGSGKSTMARKISDAFHIPHIHLDRLWFEANGHTLKKEDSEGKEKVRDAIRRKIEAAIQQDSWVSDGWYLHSQCLIAEKADQIVFLDIPLWRRIANHWYRVFFTDRHPELSRWNDLRFTTKIIQRTFTHGVKMQQFMREHPDKAVYLRSYKAVDAYVANLERL